MKNDKTKKNQQPETEKEENQKEDQKLNFGLWLEVLTKPVETIIKERQNENWRNALLNYSISGVVSGLIIGIALLIIIYFYPAALGSEASLIPSNPVSLIPSTIILIPIIWAAMLLASSLINTLVFWIFSKIFKGKGTYLKQYYLTSIYTAPVNILAAVFMLVPIAIVSIVLIIILALYSIYGLFITLKATHEYSNTEAVLSIIAPVIIIFAVIFIIANML